MPWALLSFTVLTINVVLDFLQITIKQPKKINLILLDNKQSVFLLVH